MNDTDISRGFDAGNYANAYETTDFERALGSLSMNRSAEYVAASRLASFALTERHEMASMLTITRWPWIAWGARTGACIAVD
jgi:hypothetical protein